MGSSFRLERLNGSIKELLGQLILVRIKDPRVGFVTITDVQVAADLETAKVYFSVMGDEEARAESEEGLRSAKNFMRKVIARELKLRNTPDFRFIYDDSLDRAMNLEETLRKLHEDEPGDS